MPGVTTNGIEFKIKGDSAGATVAVDSLRKSLNKLEKVNYYLISSGISAISNGIAELSQSVKKLDVSKVTEFAKAVAKISRAGASISSGFSDLPQVGKNIDSVATSANKLQDAIPSKYALLDPQKQWAADMTSIVEAQDKGFWANMRETMDTAPLERFGQAVSSIASKLFGVSNASKSASNGVKEVSRSIKSVAHEAKKADSPLANFLSSLKRIAFYRMIRGVIKAITQAFQEGLKNAYQFSKATGDGAGLAGALDRLATTSMTMKNQLGAAFGGLLTAITPIVVQIINLVTRLAEALTRLMAILGGGGVYLRAKENWTEWGEAAAGAGGAAKKALEYLAPFDELNVLPDPKSGGGGGGGGTDWGDMFEYVNVADGFGFADVISDVLDSITKFFEETDWREIADNLWRGIKESFSDEGKATQVIEALARTLGAVSGGAAAFTLQLGKDIGTDIVEAAQTAIMDYDQNGKISFKELIDSLFLADVVGKEFVKIWLDEHFFNPFFEEFAKGFGMSGREEMSDAITNFGIDIINFFTQKVINPVISAWNNMVDSLPQWLKDVIKKITGVDTLTIPLIGEIDHVDTAGLTAQQKIIKGMTAGLTRAQDQIPAKDKKIDSVGEIKSLSKDYKASGMSKTNRMITAIGNIKSISRDYNAPGMAKDKRSINSIANMKTVQDSLSANSKIFDTKAKFSTAQNALPGGSTTFSSKAKFDSAQNALPGGSTTFSSIANINRYLIDKGIADGSNMRINATANVTRVTGMTAQVKAAGGALFGGLWHNIPQYASGTTRAGSLFVAGEAGPEVVGHIGGRTEVLNRSQLAATMYSAVKSAMASVAFHVAATPSANYTMSDSDSGDALYRAFRRALDETDFGGDIELDGQTLYRAMVNRNRQNTRVTGVNAMA